MIIIVTLTFYSLSRESFKAVGISSVFEVLYACCDKDTSSHDKFRC